MNARMATRAERDEMAGLVEFHPVVNDETFPAAASTALAAIAFQHGTPMASKARLVAPNPGITAQTQACLARRHPAQTEPLEQGGLYH